MQGSRREKARRSGKIGKGGEHIVAGHILLRGMGVYFPASDEGVDLIAENGCRIQVKTAHIRYSKDIKKWYNGVYSFHFHGAKFFATSSSTVQKRMHRKFSEYCDVVVLYGVEHNRFWIVPSHLLDGAHTVFMGPTPHRAYEPEADKMRAMRAEGLSTYVIAKKLGLHQSTVYERLQKLGTPTFGKGPSAVARMSEDAWQHILDFGKPQEAVVDAQAINGVLASVEKE